MMGDPYQTLGVSRNSSDDEIKKAYRNLSRKYHPDANMNNPNKEQAEALFKDIQQAYQTIMEERTKGYSNSYSNFEQSSDSDSRYMKAVANYINNASYQEAYNLLQSIQQKTATWYYYSAIANSGLGNNVIAIEHVQMAINMEPNNLRYQSLLQRLRNGGGWYHSQSDMYGRPAMDGSRCCMRALLYYLMCSFFTGGLGACCGSGYGRNAGSLYNGYSSYNTNEDTQGK